MDTRDPGRLLLAVVLGWWIKDESLTLAIVCAAGTLADVALVARGEKASRNAQPPVGPVDEKVATTPTEHRG